MLSIDVFLNPLLLPLARLLVKYKCVAIADISLWLENRTVYVLVDECLRHPVCKGLYVFIQRTCPRPPLERIFREILLEKITLIQLF